MMRKRMISGLLAGIVWLGSVPLMAQENVVRAVSHAEMLEAQLEMPVVSIDTLGNSVSTKETYVDAQISVWDETGAVNLDAAEIGIRLRGNITLTLDKKSYKIKFPAKQNPLGLGDGAGKTWNLVANYYDTSMLRNMAAYHLGDLMDGIPYSANSRSVEVYVNGSYQGVYLLCEAVNVNKSRIAITERPEAVAENGYLLEMTRYAEEQVFAVDSAQYEVKSDLSVDAAVQTEQMTYITAYTQSALDALKRGNQTQVAQLIDIPSLVDNYIANEICKNVDAGWDSFYLYKDAGGKLTFAPMWDYDLALGNNREVKGMTAAAGLNVFNVSNCNANSNPWFCYAMQAEWFRAAVATRWKEVFADVQTLPAFITAEAASNAQSYARNFTKWNTLGTSVYAEPDAIASLTTHTAHAAYLADWVQERLDWLNTYYASDAFQSGIFLDEHDQAIDTKNAVAASPLMFWGGEGIIDPDSPGFTAEASSGWWGAQAISSGIMLQKGQTYRLSFDYSTDGNASVNVRLQQNYGSYTAYYRDSVQASATVQHFEQTLTATADDSNCALVLEFSGQGTVTVTHLSLVRVEAERVLGDVNADGKLDGADVTMLQNWLLGKGTVTDWQAGDMDENGVLNAVDSSCMKRRLLASL